MARAEATALIRASNKKLRGDLRKSRRMFDRSFKKTGKSIKKSLRGALAPLGVAVGVAGLAVIGKQVLDFEEGLTRLAIQAKQGSEFIGRMRDTVTSLSRETGIAREQILAAANGIVNLEGAAGFSEEKLRVLVRTNLATGASMDTLAGIAFALNKQFFNGTASAEELEGALGAITAAGKEGSIPLDQMASILRKVAPIMAKTGATGKKAAADLSALLQVGALGAFGGPEEIATGFKSFVRAAEKSRDRLKKLGGFDPFREVAGGGAELKDIRTLLADIGNSKLAKRPDLLIKALGRGEAADFGVAILKNIDLFEGLAQEAERAGDVIKRDAEFFQKSVAGRTKISFNKMKLAIVEAFTPARIEAFASGMEKLATILEFMVDNAEIFIAVWATFKIGSLVSGFASIAGSLSAGAGSAVGIAGNLGKAVPLLGALALGFGFGTALDELFGISDKISDLLVDTEKRRVTIETGLLRSQAQKLGFKTRALEELRAPQGKTALGRREKLAAAGITRSAREAGILTETGEIDPEAAFKVAERKEALSPFEQVAAAQGGLEAISPATAELIEAIKFAQQAQAKQLVDINVTVDQQGMLRAAETEESKARRSSQ